MKYAILSLSILLCTVCKANLITNPAYSYLDINIWHDTIYGDSSKREEKYQKPIKSSPEPSSALLIAVGVALLALRRKKNENKGLR